MYTFTSPRRNATLHIMIVALLVCAAVLMGVSQIDGVPYPVIYQMVALVVMTAWTYLLVRYALKQYRYEIAEGGIVGSDGIPVPDLVITEIVGKKMTDVARIALREISEVRVIDRSKDKRGWEDKRDAICRGKRVFRYENAPFVPASCYIAIPSEGSVLVIPPDDGMMKILERYCREQSVKEETV